MKKISESFKARRAAKLQAEDGFSLIDVVVTVAIIVALSVGGFIAYNGIVSSAQQAAVQGAADQVYTAAMTAYNSTDGNSAALTAAVEKVVEDYNTSQGADPTIEVDATIAANGDITVTAEDLKHDKVETVTIGKVSSTTP